MSQQERHEAVNEIRLMASIVHPNVVSYHEAFIDGNKLWCAMPAPTAPLSPSRRGPARAPKRLARVLSFPPRMTRFFHIRPDRHPEARGPFTAPACAKSFQDLPASTRSIVMEFAPYGDLARAIRKGQAMRKPFPEDMIWSFFIQVRSAVA